jgi:hypothetical protein
MTDTSDTTMTDTSDTTMTDTSDTTMTDTSDTETAEPTTDRPAASAPETLGEMSHTNPYTGQVFGDTQTYGRGKAVAADGGEAAAEAAETGEERRDDEATMRDVAHEPPGNADGAQAAYDRGAGHE